MIIINRWFVNGNGRPKRIAKEWEPFKRDAIELKDRLHPFELLKVMRHFKEKYNLSLDDTRDFVVAFIGHYDNDKVMSVFTKERYDRGCEIARQI